MENVIVVLIDSVYSKCVTEDRLGVSCTPFIDTLTNKGCFAPNVYSYGPYTDAATKGLYSGKPTLSDYGYYYSVGSSNDNHFKTFKLNGYETYGLYYPYYLISSKIEQYIDHSIYTSGFLYASVWNGKFEYYAKIQKERPLSKQEYNIVIKCMEMVFDCWMRFYDNYETQHGSNAIVRRLHDRRTGSGKIGLIKEYNLFCADQVRYMDTVLSEGMNHNLANINDFEFGKNAKPEFINEVYKRYASFFSKLERRNMFLNIKNNHLSVKKSLQRVRDFVKTGNKKELRYFGNYGMCVLSPQMTKKRSKSGNSASGKWQNLCSLDRQVKTILHMLGKRDDERPFYASLHCLEPHHDISFFSYDCDDMDQIFEELTYIRPIVDNCDNGFAGNLVYYLSLRYVDLCVKRLFEGLEKMHLLHNTTVMLVSDHGTSYVHYPIRNNVVNTFHKENYNIPVFIYNNSINRKKVCEGLFSAEDIYPTLYDIVGIKNKYGFNGTSMIRCPQGRRYVITEYMGPGCPDMVIREVWIAIRNEKYVLAYKNSIASPLDLEHPAYVYDLSIDPFELTNYAQNEDIIKSHELMEMKEAVKARFNEIQLETKAILLNFDNFHVI